MKPKGMPSLRDTGRRYLDQTRGARLASPGVERFVSAQGRGAWAVAAAALLVAALIGAIVWLARAG